MQQHSIRVDDIQVGERHRALSQDAVDRLSASMKDLGLMQPISIRVVDEMMLDGDLTAGVPILVAGQHRLAAAKALGWTHIDCVEIGDDPISAELWEIAENLHRLDLTKEQRDEHIRRYDDLLSQRIVLQNAKQIEPETKRGRPVSNATKIAAETGLSYATVHRALKPQPKVVPIKSVIEPETEEEAITREANAIVAAWNRARQAARDLALEQIDTPVFDRTAAGR